MMRFVYSLVRFVPDPARGEYINVGAVVGSDECSAWGVRQIGSSQRARAIGPSFALTAVWSFIDRVGEAIDGHHETQENLFDPHLQLSEDWLERLYHDHRNIVQLSPPTPMLAESADDALDQIFDLLILDPAHEPRRAREKTEIVTRLRTAYRDQSIARGHNMWERVVLSADNYQQRLDFAVTNGVAVQLTHSWSFQLSDQDRLARQIKSWGWTISSIRSRGGYVSLDTKERAEVARDVAIEAVYIPPLTEHESFAYREGLSVFQDLGVRAVPLEHVATVAKRARDILGPRPQRGLSF